MKTHSIHVCVGKPIIEYYYNSINTIRILILINVQTQPVEFPMSNIKKSLILNRFWNEYHNLDKRDLWQMKKLDESFLNCLERVKVMSNKFLKLTVSIPLKSNQPRKYIATILIIGYNIAKSCVNVQDKHQLSFQEWFCGPMQFLFQWDNCISTYLSVLDRF